MNKHLLSFVIMLFSTLFSACGFGKKVIAYSETELNQVDNYIEESFGKISKVYHETVALPGDIHMDIAIIEPDENHDYYTLVTMNVGAYKMKTLQSGKTFPRMELVVRLPKDWNFESEKGLWPIKMLKMIGRYPLYCNEYIADGHTIGSEDKFSEDLPYSNVLISFTPTLSGAPAILTLENKKQIVFYDVIPLYDEEVEYSINKGSEALHNLMEGNGFPFPPIIRPQRPNYCISPMK